MPDGGVGCSQKADKQLVTISEETQAFNVAKEFKALNDSLLLIKDPETRGDGFLTFCAVASADITGAYEVGKIGAKIGSLIGPKGAAIGAAIGGLIGGAGASYGAYEGLTKSTSVVSSQTVINAYIAVLEDNPLLDDYYPEEVNLELPEEKKDLQEIGVKHNLILEKLTDQEFSSTQIEDVLTSLELEIINSAEFEEGYYSVLDQITIDNYDTYVDNDGSTGNIVMNLYLDIINKYPEQLNDVEFVSNKYIELISKSSELSEEEKDLLYSAISVAASSFEYWKSKGF